MQKHKMQPCDKVSIMIIIIKIVVYVKECTQFFIIYNVFILL